MNTQTNHVSGANNMTDHKIKVMLVDDSAVIRGLIARSLEAEKDIEVVSSLHNGDVAVKNIAKNKPDVVILDIEMPVMDGITALPLLLKESPKSKIIICSTLSSKGADISLNAMRLGATDCIVKPTSTSEIGGADDFRTKLVATIRNIAVPSAPVSKAVPQTQTSSSNTANNVHGNLKLKDKNTLYTGKPSIVAIASSTGGPQALFKVLSDLKSLPVPILITQHMPKTFTRILAQHIEQNCGVVTHEGEDGMAVENGHAYVAPGGLHMEIRKSAEGQLKLKIQDDPPEKYCKPSAEPMFRSIHQLYGNKALLTVLTGMGNDGVDAATAMVNDGTYLIAQDEATSVVWGMPGAVAQAGICAEILPIENIGKRIREKCLGV